MDFEKRNTDVLRSLPAVQKQSVAHGDSDNRSLIKLREQPGRCHKNSVSVAKALSSSVLSNPS